MDSRTALRVLAGVTEPPRDMVTSAQAAAHRRMDDGEVFGRIVLVA